MSELKILIEALLHTPAEIEFAHHFCEETSNLNRIFRGYVHAKLCRIESGELCGEIKWKESLITLVTFKPSYVSPRRSEFYGGALGIKIAISSWQEWFPYVLKPTATLLIEDQLRNSTDILLRLDEKNGKRVDDLLREIHPEWYYFDD